MQEITTRSDMDAVLGASEAILLKHGAHCPISASARKELATFAADHPDAAVALLEVTAHRELSDQVADQLGVPHQSPQALLLRDGEVAWQATHFDITARALEAQLAR